jgi:alpha-glucosidase
MLLGVRMVNSIGLSGIAFAGYDVGGFVGDANSKLFARWVSIGALSPFFRGHSMINSRDSEPWAYGEEVEQISRNYIRFRYQLMPYIYSLFFDAAKTGMPVQRSLAIYYPHDWKIYDGQFYNQYLFGPSLLVAPVESTKEFVKVYFPEGDWYSLYDGQRYAGNTEEIVESPVHRLPVFVKAGALLPMKTATASTKEKYDQLILHVYIGHHDNSFLYYDDDGSSFRYQQGELLKRHLQYVAQERKVVIGATIGTYASTVKKIKIVLHGAGQHDRPASVNGHPVLLRKEVNRFFEPQEKFDPIYDPEPTPQEDVLAVETAFIAEEITLQW